MKPVFFSIIIFILFSTSAFAQDWKQIVPTLFQDWKQIVPLISNCEDVKRILKIDKCELGAPVYEYPTHHVIVWFSQKGCSDKCRPKEECWNVPKGTVSSVIIGFNLRIPLKDYESDFSNYQIEKIPDLPDSMKYISKEKGIELTVINYVEEKKEKELGLDKLSNLVIQSILLYPSAENNKKFKCR